MKGGSKRLVYGKGIKGCGRSKIDGKIIKAYGAWVSMLQRCYDPKSLSKYPTYLGCEVCDEWLFFPAFQAWFCEHYVEGYQLDKDLLKPENKIYSSETCVFVPQAINSLFTNPGMARGLYPQGVSWNKRDDKFQANLKIDGVKRHLGYFTDVNDAHQAYVKAKRENVIRMANKWRDKITPELYEALLKKADEYEQIN